MTRFASVPSSSRHVPVQICVKPATCGGQRKKGLRRTPCLESRVEHLAGDLVEGEGGRELRRRAHDAHGHGEELAMCLAGTKLPAVEILHHHGDERCREFRRQAPFVRIVLVPVSVDEADHRARIDLCERLYGDRQPLRPLVKTDFRDVGRLLPYARHVEKRVALAYAVGDEIKDVGLPPGIVVFGVELVRNRL